MSRPLFMFGMADAPAPDAKGVSRTPDLAKFGGMANLMDQIVERAPDNTEIVLHMPQGHGHFGADAYGPGSWWLMPPEDRGYFRNHFKHHVGERCWRKGCEPSVFLAPVNFDTPAAIINEISPWIEAGFRTFWFDASSKHADRVAELQRAMEAEGVYLRLGIEAFPLNGWNYPHSIREDAARLVRSMSLLDEAERRGLDAGWRVPEGAEMHLVVRKGDRLDAARLADLRGRGFIVGAHGWAGLDLLNRAGAELAAAKGDMPHA